MKLLKTFCLALLLGSCGQFTDTTSSISGRTDQGDVESKNRLYVEFNINSPDSLGIRDAELQKKVNSFTFSLTNFGELCSDDSNVLVSEGITGGGKKIIVADNRCEYRASLTYSYAPEVPPDSADASVSGSGGEEAAANLAPTYENFAKNLIDTNCATAGCHITGATSPDLTTYAGVLTSFQEETAASNSYFRMRDEDANGQKFPLSMPVSGRLEESILKQVEAWKDAGFPENESSSSSGAGLTAEGDPVPLYESAPMVLSAKILKNRGRLNLSFDLLLTPEGEAEGLKNKKIRTGFLP